MVESSATVQFDLNTEMARFPPDGPSGRRAETLIKSADLRVVLVTMRAGTELQEHTAPGTITIQPLAGRFALMVEGDERPLPVGSLASLASGTRHAVRALDDGAFLLTIAWPGDAVGDKR